MVTIRGRNLQRYHLDPKASRARQRMAAGAGCSEMNFSDETNQQCFIVSLNYFSAERGNF